MTALNAMVGGMAGTVLVCAAIVLGAQRWYPPGPAVPVTTANDHLRAELHAAEYALAAERAAHAETRLQLDTARRNAVWVPRRDDGTAADLIPAQALPTTPAP